MLFIPITTFGTTFKMPLAESGAVESWPMQVTILTMCTFCNNYTKLIPLAFHQLFKTRIEMDHLA